MPPLTSWFEVVGLANRFSPGPRRGGNMCFLVNFSDGKKHGEGGKHKTMASKKMCRFLLCDIFCRGSPKLFMMFVYRQWFQRL